ncbi:hypothetical protein M8J76_007250 [Diaphorina citri]|nr:hypothetical protein M8J76_007250 [Diaphorina citri]
MYHLLAICLVLHPQCIDESIQQVLRDKNYHEKMFKMQMGDVQEFENCFLFACPKFLSATPPSVTDPSEATTDDYVKEAIKHQTQAGPGFDSHWRTEKKKNNNKCAVVF